MSAREKQIEDKERESVLKLDVDRRHKSLLKLEKPLAEKESSINTREQMLVEKVIPDLEAQSAHLLRHQTRMKQHPLFRSEPHSSADAASTVGESSESAKVLDTSSIKPSISEQKYGDTEIPALPEHKSILSQNEVLQAWTHLTARSLEADEKERQVKDLYSVCGFAVRVGEQQRLQKAVNKIMKGTEEG